MWHEASQTAYLDMYSREIWALDGYYFFFSNTYTQDLENRLPRHKIGGEVEGRARSGTFCESFLTTPEQMMKKANRLVQSSEPWEVHAVASYQKPGLTTTW